MFASPASVRWGRAARARSGGSTRWRLGTAGISSLEFVVVASVFFTLMFAVMDLGRFFLTKSSLNSLVAGAARSAMIDSVQSNCATYCGAPLSGTALQTLAAPTPFIDPTKLTLNVIRTGGQNAATLSVTASYPYSFALPVLQSLRSGQLSASSQVSY